MRLGVAESGGSSGGRERTEVASRLGRGCGVSVCSRDATATWSYSTRGYDAMTGPESVRTGYCRALFPIPTRALTDVTVSLPATL